MVCMPSYFLQLLDTFFFDLFHVDTYNSKKQKTPTNKKQNNTKQTTKKNPSEKLCTASYSRNATIFCTSWKFNVGHQFESFMAKNSTSYLLAQNLLAVYELDQILHKADFLNVLRCCAPTLSVGQTCLPPRKILVAQSPKIVAQPPKIVVNFWRRGITDHNPMEFYMS